MRTEQLTFTRFIAAILVVFFHYGEQTFFYKNSYLQSLFFNGYYFVSYFFILSGFVMIIAYNSFRHINPKDFYINRIARIYPLYIVALLLTVLYNLIFKIGFVTVPFILNLFMIQAWIPSQALSINFVAWSLSVEIFFYLIFPFLFNFVYKKYSLKTITIVVILFWLISQIFFHLENSKYPKLNLNFLLFNPILHLNEFLIGNLAGLFFFRITNSINIPYKSILIIVCLMLFCLMLKHPHYLNYRDGLLAIIFIPLILLLSLEKGIFNKILKTKVFIFLGCISYGIYILQHPVYIYSIKVFKYLGIEHNFYRYLFVLLIISSISYLIIEKPLRRFIKKEYTKKTGSTGNFVGKYKAYGLICY
jgi:peptidoglycan/LPS O-acetylase OafA/YrhL